MDKIWVYYLLAIASVLIADISQIILKKAAVKHYIKWYQAYLNIRVVTAYMLFGLSTVCSVISLRKLPLSLSPLWLSLGQIFVALLSYFFLKEKITKRKLIGIAVIIVGIVVFSIGI